MRRRPVLLRLEALLACVLVVAGCASQAAQREPNPATTPAEIAQRPYPPAPQAETRADNEELDDDLVEAPPPVAATAAPEQPVGPPADEERKKTHRGGASIDDLLDGASGRTELRRESPGQRASRDRSSSAPSRASADKASPAAPAKRSSEALNDLVENPFRSSANVGSGSLGTTGQGRGAGALGGVRAKSASAMPAAIAAPIQQGAIAVAPAPESNSERYAHRADNAFEPVSDAPLSTFSIDVDTASYSNVRRFLRDRARPPIDAVRIEELINYFHYDYGTPDGDDPVALSTEISTAPWSTSHRLVRIGLRTRAIERDQAPPSNLVFLIDVSGSMQSRDKLPLLKQGLSLLAARMRPQDHVALVVYAGASGLVLPPTPGNASGRVLEALDRLDAGGSTNGGDGIRLAYQVARDSFVKGGVNRVVLATDGDFNVGTTSEGELVRLIEEERKSGVFLTVLGFGAGNLNDSGMEALADHGNGNYAYIDSIAEAHKVLVRESGGTLITVAKDVKLQIEWNPTRVESYRLIGFENRRLAARDFNDDEKDAGELGAGHTVTALYEVVPRSAVPGTPAVDALRYQATRPATVAARSDELFTVKLRYKRPDSEQSRLWTKSVRDEGKAFEQTSDDYRWATAVAGFGMLLRDSPHRRNTSYELIKAIARDAVGSDPSGERHELLGMMGAAESMGFGGPLARGRGRSEPGTKVAQRVSFPH